MSICTAAVYARRNIGRCAAGGKARPVRKPVAPTLAGLDAIEERKRAGRSSRVCSSCGSGVARGNCGCYWTKESSAGCTSESPRPVVSR